MKRTISATQARIHFGELLLEAQNGPVTVEKDGKPLVVVISTQAYKSLESAAKTNDWRSSLDEAHRRIRAELGGRSLPAPEEIIRQERQARDERFDPGR